MFPKRRQPTHPGVILEEDFLRPLCLSPKKFAEKLGGDWSEIKVNALLKGKEGISKKAAQELATALGTTAEFWTRLEHKHYEWEKIHKQNEKGALKPLKKAQ